MVNKFQIKSEEDWIRLQEVNNDELILFKFSPICGTSSTIERRIENWLSKIHADLTINFLKINVITERELSRKIAKEINIKHESPQLIWFSKENKLKWYGSHFEISEEELDKNLERNYHE